MVRHFRTRGVHDDLILGFFCHQRTDVDFMALSRAESALVEADKSVVEKTIGSEQTEALPFEVVNLPSSRATRSIVKLVLGTLAWPTAFGDTLSNAALKNEQHLTFESCHERMRSVLSQSREEFEALRMPSKRGSELVTGRTQPWASLALHVAFFAIEGMVCAALTTFELQRAQKLVVQARPWVCFASLAQIRNSCLMP